LLDGDSRLAGLEQLVGDPLVGVTTTRWIYAGTQQVDGLLLPHSATVQRRGVEFISVRLLDARFDEAAKLAESEFALDPRFVERVVPPLAIEELRPGLWEVSNAGGGFYRVQFAELPDRIVAYDAPMSRAAAQAVIAKLREKVPAKPISHVVLSHFHNDHVGGAGAFAESGAVLVTTPQARAVIERLIRAPAPLAGVADPVPPPSLKFELIDAEVDLGTPARPLKVVIAGGSPHVDQMLVLYDVNNRVAMAADMYSDTAPFNPTFDWFAGWLAARGGVDLLAGAHHAAAPMTSVMQKRAEWKAKQPARQAGNPGAV
jgi:glyoxylase-like metal-dependent hydrolase (beta-lactamase superfamily II)